MSIWENLITGNDIWWIILYFTWGRFVWCGYQIKKSSIELKVQGGVCVKMVLSPYRWITKKFLFHPSNYEIIYKIVNKYKSNVFSIIFNCVNIDIHINMCKLSWQAESLCYHFVGKKNHSLPSPTSGLARICSRSLGLKLSNAVGRRTRVNQYKQD